MQLAGLVASKAPSELDDTCAAAAPKTEKNEVSVTCNKELNILVLSDSSPDAGLELVTFVAADSVGCCRHLHLAAETRASDSSLEIPLYQKDVIVRCPCSAVHGSKLVWS